MVGMQAIECAEDGGKEGRVGECETSSLSHFYQAWPSMAELDAAEVQQGVVGSDVDRQLLHGIWTSEPSSAATVQAAPADYWAPSNQPQTLQQGISLSRVQNNSKIARRRTTVTCWRV